MANLSNIKSISINHKTIKDIDDTEMTTIPADKTKLKNNVLLTEAALPIASTTDDLTTKNKLISSDFILTGPLTVEKSGNSNVCKIDNTTISSSNKQPLTPNCFINSKTDSLKFADNTAFTNNFITEKAFEGAYVTEYNDDDTWKTANNDKLVTVKALESLSGSDVSVRPKSDDMTIFNTYYGDKLTEYTETITPDYETTLFDEIVDGDDLDIYYNTSYVQTLTGAAAYKGKLSYSGVSHGTVQNMYRVSEKYYGFEFIIYEVPNNYNITCTETTDTWTIQALVQRLATFNTYSQTYTSKIDKALLLKFVIIYNSTSSNPIIFNASELLVSKSLIFSSSSNKNYITGITKTNPKAVYYDKNIYTVIYSSDKFEITKNTN